MVTGDVDIAILQHDVLATLVATFGAATAVILMVGLSVSLDLDVTESTF